MHDQVAGRIIDTTLSVTPPDGARWSTRRHIAVVPVLGRFPLAAGQGPANFGAAVVLRNIKVTELKYRPDGSIETIDAYQEK